MSASVAPSTPVSASASAPAPASASASASASAPASAKKRTPKKPSVRTEASIKEVVERVSLATVQSYKSKEEGISGSGAYSMSFDYVFRDPAVWVERGWDAEPQPRGIIYDHDDLLASITVKDTSSRGRVKLLYIVPLSDGFAEVKWVKKLEGGTHGMVGSVKKLYSFTEGKGKNKVEFSGLLAGHTYTTQNLRNFIHKVIRIHNPAEFQKLRHGTWTDPATGKQVAKPSLDKALKYAKALGKGRMEEARASFNAYVTSHRPQQGNFIITQAMEAEIWNIINNGEKVKAFPLLEEEKEEIGEWFEKGETITKKKGGGRKKKGDTTTTTVDVNIDTSIIAELYDNHIELLGLSHDDYDFAKLNKKLWDNIKVQTQVYENFYAERDKLTDQLIEKLIAPPSQGHGTARFANYFKEVVGLAKQIDKLGGGDGGDDRLETPAKRKRGGGKGKEPMSKKGKR